MPSLYVFRTWAQALHVELPKMDVTGKEGNNKKIGWTTLWKHLQQKKQNQQVERMEPG